MEEDDDQHRRRRARRQTAEEARIALLAVVGDELPDCTLTGAHIARRNRENPLDAGDVFEFVWRLQETVAFEVGATRIVTVQETIPIEQTGRTGELAGVSSDTVAVELEVTETTNGAVDGGTLGERSELFEDVLDMGPFVGFCDAVSD